MAEIDWTRRLRAFDSILPLYTKAFLQKSKGTAKGLELLRDGRDYCIEMLDEAIEKAKQDAGMAKFDDAVDDELDNMTKAATIPAVSISGIQPGWHDDATGFEVDGLPRPIFIEPPVGSDLTGFEGAATDYSVVESSDYRVGPTLAQQLWADDPVTKVATTPTAPTVTDDGDDSTGFE